MRQLLFAGFLLVVPMGYVAWVRLPRDWEFSRTAWWIAPDTSREEMAQDYLANHAEPGVAREQIVADLGQPDQASDCWTWWSEADPVAGAAAPREPALHVWFDRQGHVERLQYAQVPEGMEALEFDPAGWRTPGQREAMAAALSSSGRIKAAMKATVRSMLGDPDEAGFSYEYIVSARSWLDDDAARLTLEFDLQDRLIGGHVE